MLQKLNVHLTNLFQRVQKYNLNNNIAQIARKGKNPKLDQAYNQIMIKISDFWGAKLPSESEIQTLFLEWHNLFNATQDQNYRQISKTIKKDVFEELHKMRVILNDLKLNTLPGRNLLLIDEKKESISIKREEFIEILVKEINRGEKIMTELEEYASLSLRARNSYFASFNEQAAYSYFVDLKDCQKLAYYLGKLESNNLQHQGLKNLACIMAQLNLPLDEKYQNKITRVEKELTNKRKEQILTKRRETEKAELYRLQSAWTNIHRFNTAKIKNKFNNLLQERAELFLRRLKKLSQQNYMEQSYIPSYSLPDYHYKMYLKHIDRQLKDIEVLNKKTQSISPIRQSKFPDCTQKQKELIQLKSDLNKAYNEFQIFRDLTNQVLKQNKSLSNSDFTKLKKLALTFGAFTTDLNNIDKIKETLFKGSKEISSPLKENKEER